MPSRPNLDRLSERVVVQLKNGGLAEVLDDLDVRLNAALDGGPRTLVIDLAAVERVSSTTFAALLWTRRRCVSRGVEVRLGRPSRRCVDALARVGLLGLLPVDPTGGAGRSRGRTGPWGLS
jgi:anti-anti-sigma regulatory factor